MFVFLDLEKVSFLCWFHCTTIINIIKPTFDFNFDLYQAFKQNGFTKTWKQREESWQLKKLVNYEN